ncbi:MAG: hypothetical protein FWD14_04210 [Treponema sp.]|nr:hypothetical protein [Treponema sp.]
MNKKPVYKILFFTAALFLCLTILHARGGKEEDTGTNRIVQVTGVVRLIGSHPFYELVIKGTEMEWHVSREERDILHDLQHRTVTVEGTETVTELTFANGFPAGVRRELRNIRIISVQ